MRVSQYFTLAAALCCVASLTVSADAAEFQIDPGYDAPMPFAAQAPPAAIPAAPPMTLWSFLGIPQGIKRIQDVTINRRGNFPGLERKPPLRGIADLANLKPDQPKVVQDAAAIKIKEDQAKQKIKAIKYLAEIGCGCHEEAAGALLSALDDCTEEVRYAAAKALAEAAGDPCEKCSGAGCCSAEAIEKLYIVACGQDETGCYLERSERVRAAACTALRACRRVVHMAPVPGPEPPGPEDTPFRLDQGDDRLLPPAPTPGGEGEPTLADPSAGDMSGIVNPITLTGMSQIDGVPTSGRRPAGTRRPTVLRDRPSVPHRIGPPPPGHSRRYVRPAIVTNQK